MLALVSSMTTTVIGWISLTKRSIACGLSLSRISKSVLRQIGNQPLLGVGHGRVEGHRARAGSKGRLLGEDGEPSSEEQPEPLPELDVLNSWETQ